MTRQEARKFFIEEIMFLNETKNLEKLMLEASNYKDTFLGEQRIKQLEKIAENVNETPMKAFLWNETLRLRKEEIPKDYLYTTAFYMSCLKGIQDTEIFESCSDYSMLLQEKGDVLAYQLLIILTRYDLSECTVRELIYGKK